MGSIEVTNPLSCLGQGGLDLSLKPKGAPIASVYKQLGVLRGKLCIKSKVYYCFN